MPEKLDKVRVKLRLIAHRNPSFLFSRLESAPAPAALRHSTWVGARLRFPASGDHFQDQPTAQPLARPVGFRAGAWPLRMLSRAKPTWVCCSSRVSDGWLEFSIFKLSGDKVCLLNPRIPVCSKGPRAFPLEAPKSINLYQIKLRVLVLAAQPGGGRGTARPPCGLPRDGAGSWSRPPGCRARGRSRCRRGSACPRSRFP